MQNAGGCFIAPPGYWPGLREIADRYGILLMADEVISGFGRLGEWFAVGARGRRAGPVSLAKGLTSAYAPMGAVVARDRVVAPLVERGRVFRHGITFGGHPLSAAIALQEHRDLRARRGARERPAGSSPHLGDRLQMLLGAADRRRRPRRRLLLGRWSWSRTRRPRASTRPSATTCCAASCPRRLREAGLIARADDRGDAVLQIAPPLISDAALLDEIVARLGDVLTDAGDHMGLGAAA